MLEIGHNSKPLKAKLPNGYTHKWTVFVRGADNAKIEHCIQRVVFQLHDSFPNPHREITEPPFQVKETGYAGFEIPIEIYFKNRDKPNHLVFVLDLCLLTDKSNSSIKSQKVSFHNPNREFEKCLNKTGAQMILMSKDKKERSDSPPAKRQKSASLIPSKDMSKQKSSKEFLDVFGAPLVVSGSKPNHSRSHPKHHHVKSESTPTTTPTPMPTPTASVTLHAPATAQATAQAAPNLVQTQQFVPQDPFQTIQDKISTLTDCDRLQKIVDIIEESGEWYNLTANKFEFDLKRLDKKTLYRIEKWVV